ncbi:MAG TPA: aminoacyl-tRNA hydrolase [Candidatus Acidoferrales bacterium]|nr:aminoacyl-tRNA hydrolase [Candidatus Acidoferrales bacterium]
MRLIVGLGNPGPGYVRTPHNLGFRVIDHLGERAGIRIQRPEGKSLIGRGRLAGAEVVLAKPQIYMNASGLAVRELIERLEGEAERIIVVVDDASLPAGALRIRERGSAGGHNGLKSVIGALGTDEFIRVRLGVGGAEPGEDLAERVLRPMSETEEEQAAEQIERAADAVELILRQGAGAAMNRFNRRAEPPGEEESAGGKPSGAN